MPYRIRRRDCRQTDGTRGSYVIDKQEGGSWEQVSCHTSREDAEAARRAREAAESASLAAQKITREEKEEILEEAQEEYEEEATLLIEQLNEGEITREEWLERMQEIVKDVNVSAYLAGKSGDWLSMEWNDWAAIGAVLGQQFGFLRAFERQMADQSLQELINRAGLYGAAAQQSMHKGYMSEIGVPSAALPAYPGDGTSECLVRCKCRWSVRIISKELGHYDATWRLGVAEHCTTCRRRARSWVGLRVRGGRLVDGYEPIFK